MYEQLISWLTKQFPHSKHFIDKAFPPEIKKALEGIPGRFLDNEEDADTFPVHLSWHSEKNGFTWHALIGEPDEQYGFIFYGYVEGYDDEYGDIPVEDLIGMQAQFVPTKPYILKEYINGPRTITEDMAGEKVRLVELSGKQHDVYIGKTSGGAFITLSRRNSRRGFFTAERYRSVTVTTSRGYSTLETGAHGTQNRISTACQIISRMFRNRRINTTRALDNCFEMGDADAVFSGMVKRAKKNQKLREAMLFFWSSDTKYRQEILNGTEPDVSAIRG